MPTLLMWRGYRFGFYSLDRFEPAHVHVVKDGNEAKIWLATMEISYNRGYSAPELRRLLAKREEHRAGWIGEWDDFFQL
ncbi:MAG: DUF4160 domain-containing protein [Rhizobiaceae bacterium]|nr:DUF4160 domain-containing protein [Rhizobiaceae bacterium]